MVYYIIGFSILSYLIGSFSSALWYGKWFYDTDIRKSGSKNAGATNALRVLGYKAAILVFITDILKGFISAQLVRLIPGIISGTEIFYQLMILFGGFAILGHIFPVYSGFKGGKGVATMLGVVLALHPAAAGLSLLIFIIVFFFTRIVSISSISAAIAFPIIIYILERNQSHTLTIFSILAFLLIIITHIKNIKRLIKGEEKKITLKK
ncbi:MAG: glycerol-3-phosphate 1-O-acyltransferase PlsY [Bacteroidales bacterium]|jgi:glycerol-3-phosphate acyltransferase PlsY|nr:glycerol-3-phosphate 1-O-acyltransferase PlsY [Bacteroidales bacterium]